MPKIETPFLEINRKQRTHIPALEVGYRDPSVRVCDFDEAILPLTPEQAMYEAC